MIQYEKNEEVRVSVCTHCNIYVHLEILDKYYNKVVGNVYLNQFEAEGLILGIQQMMVKVKEQQWETSTLSSDQSSQTNPS